MASSKNTAMPMLVLYLIAAAFLLIGFMGQLFDGGARWYGWIGLVVGLIFLFLGLLGISQRRRD